jgi:hypothetical protein
MSWDLPFVLTGKVINQCHVPWSTSEDVWFMVRK